MKILKAETETSRQEISARRIFSAVTPRLGRDFVFGRCKKQANGSVGTVEKLCEEVETVKSFCYLGDRVNAMGSCEAAVTARARIGWVKIKECGE